jgi:hypothetical protein
MRRSSTSGSVTPAPTGRVARRDRLARKCNGYSCSMPATAPTRGDRARSGLSRVGDAFAFGSPPRRSRSSVLAPAAELFAERPSDLPPVWIAVARLAVFLGCLAIVVSLGTYVVVHALVRSVAGFLGGTP